MTDHDHSAPAATPNIDDCMAMYEAFRQRARALRSANKAALFTVLEDAGIAYVIVTFDGCGDSGQIESVEVQGAVAALPDTMTEFAFAQHNDGEAERHALSIAAAVEELAYDCLREHHDGWENNEGAFGAFTFDVAKRTIALDFSYRIESTEDHTHEF